MADVVYSWPARDKASVIGKSTKRLDGMEKSTGAATIKVSEFLNANHCLQPFQEL